MSLFDISLPDLLTFILLLGASSWMLLKIYTQMETENSDLKARNAQLSQWLQLAELQTGIPYYSSVAITALPHEHSSMFMQIVQSRVKALPVAPVYPVPLDASAGAADT